EITGEGDDRNRLHTAPFPPCWHSTRWVSPPVSGRCEQRSVRADGKRLHIQNHLVTRRSSRRAVPAPCGAALLASGRHDVRVARGEYGGEPRGRQGGL